MNEKNILGFKLRAEAEIFFQFFNNNNIKKLTGMLLMALAIKSHQVIRKF